MTGRRNQLLLFGVLAFGAVGALGLVLSGVWAPLQPMTDPADSIGSADESAAELPAEPTGAVPLVVIDVVRSRIGVSEPTQVSIGEAPLEAATESVALAVVGLLVQGDVWLDDSVSEVGGSLAWGPSPSQRVVRPVTMASAERGSVELSGVPLSHDEFQDIHIAGLVFRPTRLHPAPAESPELAALLEVEPVPGATLVWSSLTPAAERLPVEIGLTGRYSPDDGPDIRSKGRVRTRGDLYLPYALPRLLRKESVWVGAVGRAWRAFPIAPEDVEITVQLAEGGSIRVLHDGPRAKRPSEQLHAVLECQVPWALQTRAISDDEPLLFDGLANGDYHVWLTLGASREAEVVSPVVRLAIKDLESLDADLTEAYIAEHLGSVRLHVSGSKAAMDVADVQLGVQVIRRAEKGARWPWVRVGPMRALEPGTDGVRSFKMIGLPTGKHVLLVEPMGTRVACEICAGEETQADLRLLDPGWLVLHWPEGYDRELSHVSLVTVEARREDRFHLDYYSELAEKLDGRYPLAPGTYRADVYPLGSEERTPLSCARFAIRSGEECVATLVPLPSLKVRVIALDAANGKALALPMNFWRNVRFLSASSGDQILGAGQFEGEPSAYTGITLELTVEPETAQIKVPKTPFWSFDPVEPVELSDGLTVILRASAK